MKDTISNVIAIVLVIAGAANTALQAQTGNGEINWFQLAFAILAAVVAYLTGKKPDLSGKQ